MNSIRCRLSPNVLQTGNKSYEYFQSWINRIVTYSQLKQIRIFSNDNKQCSDRDKKAEKASHNLFRSISTSNKVFKDKDADIILDISEQQQTINLEDLRIDEKRYDPYEGLDLKRGISGVFEIEELVSLLQRDNAKNIFVASVPPELSYVNYIVVVTGRSNKHMKALATFIRKVYKLKRHKTDMIPKIEGEDSKDWIALDLGNIVLHIFSHSVRLSYDLETLWSVGPNYDDKSKTTSEDIMEQYNTFLLNLEPIENDNENREICEKR